MRFALCHTAFAIREGQLNSRNAALNSELVKKQIEADIERGLTAKGLTRVTGPSSDLNVRYTFGSARKTEVETYPAGWYGLGTRAVRVPYAEGTLVIDFRDPTTRSLVWRAIGVLIAHWLFWMNSTAWALKMPAKFRASRKSPCDVAPSPV